MNKVDKEIARVKNEARWKRIKLGMDGFVLLVVIYDFVCLLILAWEGYKLI